MAKQQFKAESKRLLDLMINSIYTHKEIFLREIISNASDALDKLLYLALTDSGVGMSREDFFIELKPDKQAQTLTISDNGIGMTKEDLEANLGVIAKSGSLKFKSELPRQGEGEETDVPDIIGQFGVGFYYAFMVSEKVTVITRAYGSDKSWKWESSGSDGYVISPCERDAVGTDVIMKFKTDCEEERYSEFLDEYTLARLVKKYSDYIRFPIRMDREKRRPKEGAEAENVEMETYVETDTLNSMVAIWQRNRNELTDEDYNTFYTEKFHDYDKPLKSIHVDAEGLVSYKALLFIPAKASYDYYTKEYQKGLQLYSNGVMIMEHCAELVPEYFRFIRGVVDSPDLSLNISREMLQHDRQLKTISGNIERKIKNELAKLLEQDRETYNTFYRAFGLQLKYGVVSDFGSNKDQLQDLLLFHSSAGEEMTTFKSYVSRMPEDQKHIYYAAGDSAANIASLPQTERIRGKGYEILYFTEEVDEFVAQVLMSYDEKAFKSINSDDPDLQTEEEKKALESSQAENKDLLDFIKGSLGDLIKEAKLSSKLVSHPVCLTAGGGISFEMERYLNSVQPDAAPRAERVLELNVEHEVFGKLKSLYETDKDKTAKFVRILYDQASLIAGLGIEDPVGHTGLVFELMI